MNAADNKKRTSSGKLLKEEPPVQSSRSLNRGEFGITAFVKKRSFQKAAGKAMRIASSGSTVHDGFNVGRNYRSNSSARIAAVSKLECALRARNAAVVIFAALIFLAGVTPETGEIVVMPRGAIILSRMEHSWPV